ncbi:cation:proton antiporter domain-containing protein [Bacillus pacificus]
MLYGYVMGFPLLETLIIAGIITISSSAIVAKVIVDLRRSGNKETELILGIIMFDDIFFSCIFIGRFRVSTRWCHIICRCSYIGVNRSRVYATILCNR